VDAIARYLMMGAHQGVLLGSVAIGLSCLIVILAADRPESPDWPLKLGLYGLLLMVGVNLPFSAVILHLLLATVGVIAALFILMRLDLRRLR
jgi:hypothetical protein